MLPPTVPEPSPAPAKASPAAAQTSPEAARGGRPRRWKPRILLGLISAGLYLGLQFSGTTADWEGFTAYICPDWHAAGMAILNIAALACWVLALICLTGRFWLGTVLAILPWAMLATAHHMKLAVMGMPLVPLDVRRALDVIPMGWEALGPGAKLAAGAGVLGIFIIAMLLDLRLALAPRTSRRRATLGAAALCVVLLVPATAPLAARHGLYAARRWDWGHCYRSDGFALSFLAFSRDLLMPRSAANLPGYSTQAVESLCQRMAADFAPSPATANPVVMPDLIVVSVESLVDPAWMPNLKFARDPLANLHRLQQESGALHAISPTFAGNSINTDFEVLTGLDASRLPPEVMAITDDLNRPVPSLATLLKLRGYRTTALIPTPPALFGHGWFFPTAMGFQQYRDAHSLGGSGVSGVSDLALADAVLQTLDGSGPQFIYAQFTRNHYPWTRGRFDHPEALPQQMPGSDEDDALGIYLQGVYESDQAIGRLAQGLRQRSRPAVLAVFGDHLPGFTSRTYQQLGLLRPGDTAQQRHAALHTTPGVIWSPQASPTGSQTLRMNALAPHLLRGLGIEHAFYTGFLANPNEADRSLLQFDLLHGNREAARLLLSR